MNFLLDAVHGGMQAWLRSDGVTTREEWLHFTTPSYMCGKQGPFENSP